MGKFLDHLPVEGRKVVRLPARHQALIHNNFLIHPLRPGVLQIGLKGRIGGHPPALDDTGIDQGPRSVADYRHRLPRVEERFDERESREIPPELVRVHDATRQQQRIILLGVRPIEGRIERDLVTPFCMIPPFHLFLSRRDDLSFGAGLLERLAGFREFDLLEAIRDKDSDLFTLAVVEPFFLHVGLARIPRLGDL
jgi:hypothetical protein